MPGPSVIGRIFGCVVCRYQGHNWAEIMAHLVECHNLQPAQARLLSSLQFGGEDRTREE